MEVTIQGEVLCEDCTTALSANALPAIAAAADGVHSAGREGGGGRVGGLDREREQLSALADEVRYGQAAVRAGDTLVHELQQAMRRHRAATARRLALVQKEIDEVLVTHSLLETEAEEVEAIARGVTGVPPEEGDGAVEEADAWARAMLLAEEVAATELAIEKEEAELVAETGGDAKLFMDGAEATVMKGIVAALSGKPTRRQLSTPPEPEPEPEPVPAPAPAPASSGGDAELDAAKSSLFAGAKKPAAASDDDALDEQKSALFSGAKPKAKPADDDDAELAAAKGALFGGAKPKAKPADDDDAE